MRSLAVSWNLGKFRAATFLLMLGLHAASPALADSGRVVPRPAQIFRGWGMSLAWEANDLYGGGRQSAQIKDAQIQGLYMDLLFGDPAKGLTLGFNVARYNIGGGDDPSHRAPLSVDGAQKLIERLGEAAWPLSRSTPTCCGTRRATRWRAAESIHAPFKHSWVADKRVRNIWAK